MHVQEPFRQICRNLSGTYGAANVQEPFRQMCRNLSGTYGAANVQEPFRQMCRNLSGKCAGTFPAHMERQMCRNSSGKCAGTFPAHMERQMCRNISGKCAGTFPAHMERQMCRNLSGTYGAPFSSMECLHAGIFPALQPKSCVSGQVPQCWECYFSTFCIFNSTFVGIMFLQNSLESQFLFSFVGSILPTLLDVSINLARFNPHDFDLSHG